MPVYEYRCDACGQPTDRILPYERVDDPGPCPECGGDLTRKWSRVAVKLQGWGFSKTDGLLPDRPGGRNDFKAVQEKAEKLADTGDV